MPSTTNCVHSLQVSVQYQVLRDKVPDSFYKLTDQSAQIRAYVFDVVRSTVPKMELDDVFTSKEVRAYPSSPVHIAPRCHCSSQGRPRSRPPRCDVFAQEFEYLCANCLSLSRLPSTLQEIAQDVKTELTKSMDTFGFAIIQTLVTDIEPAAKVKAAMNDINAAKRLRAAAAEKAEAEKIQVVKAAEADAESKFLAGQGIARQRQAIINGLRESVKVCSTTSPVAGLWVRTAQSRIIQGLE